METKKYNVCVKGTWYLEINVEACSQSEAEDKAIDEARNLVFSTTNIPFILGFNDFDYWIE